MAPLCPGAVSAAQCREPGRAFRRERARRERPGRKLYDVFHSAVGIHANQGGGTLISSNAIPTSWTTTVRGSPRTAKNSHGGVTSFGPPAPVSVTNNPTCSKYYVETFPNASTLPDSQRMNGDVDLWVWSIAGGNFSIISSESEFAAAFPKVEQISSQVSSVLLKWTTTVLGRLFDPNQLRWLRWTVQWIGYRPRQLRAGQRFSARQAHTARGYPGQNALLQQRAGRRRLARVHNPLTWQPASRRAGFRRG